MKNLFVPYELAVKLKEKRFQASCFGGYSNLQELNITRVDFQSDIEGFCLAPIYQQAINWFREEHKLVLDVFQEFNGTDAYTGKWEVDISELGDYKQPHRIVVDETYADYYEAWNAAIEAALENI